MTARVIALTTAFRYSHGLGGLSPWAEGLERGEALATRCSACKRVWFAPRLVCICGGREMEWLTLPGTGVVRTACEGSLTLPLTDRSGVWPLGLVAMDGADNAVLGRLATRAAPLPGLRVRLTLDPGARAHPVQAALFLPLDPLNR